jgi:hypothetical protein
MALRLESSEDMAAANTPATTSPMRPTGSWVSTKWGTMRSALTVPARIAVEVGLGNRW